jgi:Sec-independent protein translocase protein TatA
MILSSIMNLASSDVVIIALVCFVLFGAKQLPKWAKGLRETRDELKKIVDGEEEKK